MISLINYRAGLGETGLPVHSKIFTLFTFFHPNHINIFWAISAK